MIERLRIVVPKLQTKCICIIFIRPKRSRELELPRLMEKIISLTRRRRLSCLESIASQRDEPRIVWSTHTHTHTHRYSRESGSFPRTGRERSYWNAANETDIHDVASWRSLAARKISLFLTDQQFSSRPADGLLFAESVILVPGRDSNIECGTCALQRRKR